MQKPIALDGRALDDDVVRDRRVETELLFVPGDANVLAVEDESADPAGPRRLGVGPGEEKNGAGVARVRDPLLRAGDAPASAVRLGAGAKRAGIRAGFRLGQCERAQVLAARERRDEA